MSAGEPPVVVGTLRLKEEISQTLQQAKAKINQALGQIGAETEKTSKKFKAFGDAASVAAGILLSRMVTSIGRSVVEMMSLGAQTTALRSAFGNLVTQTGGYTLSLEKMRKATRGTVADVDLLRYANQAMSLGLPTDQIDELFGAAIKLSRAMGIDARYAVESLTTGIGRQSKLILDNLGIVFRAEQAYAWYAESIGTTASALDESQRRLAWQRYAIEMVTQKAKDLGDVQDDVLTLQQQWNASIKNFLTNVGQALGPLGAFKGVIEMMLPAMSILVVRMVPGMLAGMKAYIALHGGLVGAILVVATALKVKAAAGMAALAALGPPGWAMIAVAIAVAGAAIWTLTRKVDAAGDASAEFGGKVQELNAVLEMETGTLTQVNEKLALLQQRYTDVSGEISRLNAEYGEQIAREEELIAKTEERIAAGGQASRGYQLMLESLGIHKKKLEELKIAQAEATGGLIEETEKMREAMTELENFSRIQTSFNIQQAETSDKLHDVAEAFMEAFGAEQLEEARAILQDFGDDYGIIFSEAERIVKAKGDEISESLEKQADFTENLIYDWQLLKAAASDSIGTIAQEFDDHFKAGRFNEALGLIRSFADDYKLTWDDARATLEEWLADQEKIPEVLEDTLIGEAQAKFEEFKNCLTDKARTLDTDVTGIMGDMADNINSLLDQGLIGEAQRQMQEYVECSSGKIHDMVEDIDGYMDNLTTSHNEKLQEMKNRAWQLSGEEKEGVLAQMDALVKEYNEKMGNLESWRQILLGSIPGLPTVPTLPVTPGQHGLDMMVNRPSLFLAGEAGPEHVRITPGGAVEKPTTVIYGPLLEVAGSVDRATAEYVIREMEQLLRNVQIQNSSGSALSTHKRIIIGSTMR